MILIRTLGDSCSKSTAAVVWAVMTAEEALAA